MFYNTAQGNSGYIVNNQYFMAISKVGGGVKNIFIFGNYFLA